MGIENQVAYLGRREDIQQFYNAMDCFLLPSLYEGLPVVGLEAESCGLPMFFSTEVTREANACELGHFIALDDSDDVWADRILKACRANMPIRSRGQNGQTDDLHFSTRMGGNFWTANHKYCTGWHFAAGALCRKLGCTPAGSRN